MAGIRWPFARSVFIISELAVKALLALAGVHAYLASCVQGFFSDIHGIHTALFLAFLGPVTIITVTAFWADHILIATAAGVFLFQIGTAFLTLGRRYRTAALHIDTCLRET
jgi:predicted MFS family arabinose efflux permease